MIVWIALASAEDLSFQCLDYAEPADWASYGAGEEPSAVADAYDTLVAYIDATCVVEDCGSEGRDTCEQVVGCVTATGDLVDWGEARVVDAFGNAEEAWSVTVVPAAPESGWSTATVTYEGGSAEADGSAEWTRTLAYSGEWAEGWPTDGVVVTRGSLTNNDAEYTTGASWDDGTCAWSVRHEIVADDGHYYRVTVNGRVLDVEWDTSNLHHLPDFWHASFESAYVGAVEADTWILSAIADADGDWYAAGEDCDDTDAATHPDGTEVPYDGRDGDCVDGDEVDVDEDGYAATVVGGNDCDDDVATTHPGASDVRGDGVDQDCNGMDQPALRRVRYGSGPLVRP